jgi:site-specific DNA-cytosine methylase
MLLLELFKGTGSFSKVAEEFNMEVISLDIDPISTPTILTNILDWDYTTIPIPDFITASPPCETFSILIAGHKDKVRDYKGDMRPLNKKGELGDAVLFKTIEIIKYFLSKNPNLKFSIENPRGFMRKMNCMKEFIEHTTLYSHYDFPYHKATNFWSNIPLNIIQVKDQPRRVLESVMLDYNLRDRYRIPPDLCRDILMSFLIN